MDDFFDDCDGGMDDGFDDDLGNEPDFEEEPTESDDRFWDGPREQDWPLILGISGDIAREKRDIERARREWDDREEDYWEWLNQK
jgi:hypothetical protein